MAPDSLQSTSTGYRRPDLCRHRGHKGPSPCHRKSWNLSAVGLQTFIEDSKAPPPDQPTGEHEPWNLLRLDCVHGGQRPRRLHEGALFTDEGQEERQHDLTEEASQSQEGSRIFKHRDLATRRTENCLQTRRKRHFKAKNWKIRKKRKLL